MIKEQGIGDLKKGKKEYRQSLWKGQEGKRRKNVGRKGEEGEVL